MKLIYEHERLQLYHGDARHMVQIEDRSVHLVATSPPYWNARDYSQWASYDAYLEDMRLAMAECYRVLCKGGKIAVNVPQGYGRPSSGGYVPIGADWTYLLRDLGYILLGAIVWDKTNIQGMGALLGTAWGTWCSARNPALRDGHENIIIACKEKTGREPGQSTIDDDTFLKATASVWKIPPAAPVNSWHSAPWPAEIPWRLTELYTYAGDTVLDPFSGSGTTAHTAARLGRRGIGVEICADYIRRSAGPLLAFGYAEVTA